MFVQHTKPQYHAFLWFRLQLLKPPLPVLTQSQFVLNFALTKRYISNTTYYILPVIAIFGLIRLHLICAFITVLFFFSSLFIYSLLSQRLIAFMIILVCGCTQIKCKSIDACDVFVCVFFRVSSWKFHSPPFDSMSFVVATNTSQL